MKEGLSLVVVREEDGWRQRKRRTALIMTDFISASCSQPRGGEVTNSHHLGSAGQEVRVPVAKAVVKTQDPEVGDNIGGLKLC